MKVLACLLVASCTLFSSAQVVQKSSPTDQDLTSEETAMVVKLANLQKNFGKKMNSPGVDLTLKEIDRSRTSDRTLVKYFLFATGLPTDLTYTLYRVQINGKITKLFEGVTLDSDGMARCAPRKAPVELVFYAGKAEPERLSLVSNDTHFKAFISVIPFPNSVTDRACKLESVIGMTKGEVTYIQGIGFEPNEELTVDGESYGEKNHAATKAEADGSYFGVALPHVLGKSSGTTRWSVKGKNCNPVLNFSWGTYQLE
jgi:hypothetical protein